MKKIDLERIRSIKPLQDFVSCLEKTSAEDLFTLTEPLQDLVRGGILLQLIHYELECMARSGEYAPREGTYNYLNLALTDNFSFTLILKNIPGKTGAKYCSNYPSDQIVIPLDREGFYYDLYRRPPGSKMNVLDKQSKLEIIHEHRLLEYGQAMSISSESDVFSFCPSEEPLTAMILSSTFMREYTWEYDSATRLPVRIVTGNNSHTRIEFTCAILGEIGNEDSVRILKALVSNDAHNVRWQAARSLCRLDLDEGISALKILLDDPHTEIRTLAERSLHKIYDSLGIQNN